MAGMFYSLKEAAEKLDKTEQQVQELIKEGKLREFRDGPNLLLKVDEVDSLAEQSQTGKSEGEEPEEEITLESGESGEQQAQRDDSKAETSDEISLEDSSSPEATESGKSEDSGEDTIAAQPESEAQKEEKQDTGEGDAGKKEDEEELVLAEDADQSGEKGEGKGSDEDLLAEDTSQLGEDEQQGGDKEGTEGTPEEGEETSGEDELLSDTGAGTGAEDQESLEEIDDDVNLDSFGSGSGLLDLSLQADDTSLGGVLDEIYSPEGEQEQQEEGKAEDVAAETEEMFPEQQAAPQPAAFTTAVEPEPDSLSNAFGISLFLPLVAVIYTSVVIVGSVMGTIPSFLSPVSNFVWYVCGGLFVIALVIIGLPVITSGSSGKAKKSKTSKKEKKAKKKEAKSKKKK